MAVSQCKIYVGPSHGGLSLNSNGSFNYIPDTNFVGTDSFTYTASDGTFASSVATVNLTVNATSEVVVMMPDPVDPTRMILVINGDETGEDFKIQPGTVDGDSQ